MSDASARSLLLFRHLRTCRLCGAEQNAGRGDQTDAGGRSAAGISIRMSGTADKLAQTWNEMVLDLVMALVIVYLVMAVLFEFLFPTGDHFLSAAGLCRR